jgi:hypothetical protein
MVEPYRINAILEVWLGIDGEYHSGIPLGAVSVWVVFSAALRSLEDALGLDYQRWEVVSLSTTTETLIMSHLLQRV